jgi:hypothetical protein
VTEALLVFYIDFKVTHHHQTAKPANAFLTPAELARFHVAFHDVDAVFLIERDAGDFAKQTTSYWQTNPR